MSSCTAKASQFHPPHHGTDSDFWRSLSQLYKTHPISPINTPKHTYHLMIKAMQRCHVILLDIRGRKWVLLGLPGDCCALGDQGQNLFPWLFQLLEAACCSCLEPSSSIFKVSHACLQISDLDLPACLFHFKGPGSYIGPTFKIIPLSSWNLYLHRYPIKAAQSRTSVKTKTQLSIYHK